MPHLLVAAMVAALTTAGNASQSDSTTKEYRKPSVVVQATRAGSMDPVAHSTIEAAPLRNAFVGQDPQFLLERLTPSLVAWSEAGTGFSNYGSFRLRGIDQTRVNVTLNGTPLNDMIDQGVFFSNITDLGNGLRSVQLQRGVGTASNGTASFAGSIDFESTDAAKRPAGATVQLSAGSFGLRRLSGEVATGLLPSGFAASARFTTFATDGFRTNSGTNTSSFFFTGSWAGSSDVIRLTTLLGATRNQLAYLAVPRDEVEHNPRTNMNNPNDRDAFGQHLIQLQHVHLYDEGAALQTTVYYGGAGGDFFVTFPNETGDLSQLNYPLRNDHIGAYSSYTTSDVGGGIGLSAGIHTYTFRRRNDEAVQPNLAEPYYSDRTVKNEASAFVKLQRSIGPLRLHAEAQSRYVAMTFTPDARFVPEGEPAFPTHDWLFVNGLVGADMPLTDELSLWASIGRTHREPTRFDLLGGTQINEANINVVRNPGTVRHERVTDTELGVRYTTDWGRVNVNGFHMRFADEIAPIGQFIEQQFVQLRKNVPASTRIGVELDAEVVISPHLRCVASGTVMRAMIDEYAPENNDVGILRNVSAVLTPSVIGNVALIAAPTLGLELELSARHLGAMWLELTNAPDMQLPPSTVVNARIGWQVSGSVRADLHLFNAFDALYATNGATDTFDGRLRALWFVQAPRNVAFTLEVRP
jgi:iron complex outermembrane receptor protein